MYRLEREEFLKSRFIWLWALLGFQAGFINSFGFLACSRFVSHVTGVGTQMGLALGRGEWWFALEMFGAPLSFILGSFLSGVYTVARIDRGLAPRYDLVTAVLPFGILALSIFGYFGFFGNFGSATPEGYHFMLLFFLSAACGMQNGCFATMTKGQIRTTHLTGIATDIGTDFARSWFGKLDPKEAILVRRTNISRVSTFACFAFGAIASVMVTQHFNFLALLIPAITSFIAYVSVRVMKYRIDQSLSKSKSPNGSLETITA